MTLRPYKPEDSKIICSWVKDEKQLFQWSADRIGKWPLPEDALNENYQGKNPELFIPLTAVDENNRPAGHLFIVYPDEADRTLVRFGFVIVSPELRGKGNGRKMLELAIKYAEEKIHAIRITLGVFANNPKARACYESVGFKEYSTRTVNILGSDWECVDMELFMHSHQEVL